MNKFLAYFTSRYQGQSLQIRKKSRILTGIAIGFLGLSLVFAAVMAATGAWVVTAVFGALALFCGSVLGLLRAGKYYLASSALLYGLFAAMFVAIKFDQYVDVYEAYVFGTLGCFLLVVTTLVADRPSQAIVIGALDLGAIQALYWLDAFPDDGGEVTTLAVQNLATASLMTVVAAFVAAFLIRFVSGLVAEVERRAAESERSYGELNAAVGAAQSSSQSIGELLSASAARTSEAIGSLRATVEDIGSGMDELETALGGSGEANQRAEASQAEVRRALAQYSDQVTRASAAIEEMAAAAAALAAQAQAKRGAVRSLVETSALGEGVLATMAGSMAEIEAAAARVAELGAVIGDVSERTNLLGMNASIEAAHAGAAGRGFAVVAAEIRGLSVEAGKSARTIGDTLKGIRAAIGAAASRSGEAEAAFRRIDAEVRGVSLMLDELLGSVQELSAGSADVVSAVEAVADLTRSTETVVAGSEGDLDESFRHMGEVAELASKVRTETAAMAAGFDAIRADSAVVRSLGERNLGTIQGLKARLDSFAREDPQAARPAGPGSRGIQVKRRPA